MQFLLIGRDGKDPEAINRRMAARPAHMALGETLRSEGKMVYAAALLDDAEKMEGSIIVYDAPDRTQLDQWLKDEPYVTGKVWEKIEITQCKTAPSFVRQPS